MASHAGYTGIYPVAPTPFLPNGCIDSEGMKRVLDCMIDQGADGICILANFSEQFLLSDDERKTLTKIALEHIQGRVLVLVTVSHFATDIVLARAREAKQFGADIVMMMPPYHGATLKGNTEQTFEQFVRVSHAGIPIMVQDAPLSGVELPVDLLARMAHEIEMVKLFKIESVQAAAKIRTLLAIAGNAVEGPFDGEEGITLLADLDAGATGSMTSALIPDLVKPVISEHIAGNRQDANRIYNSVLPIINFENRQCGFRAAKTAMMEGGVIESDFCRHPVLPLHPDTRAQLLELLRPFDPVILRWGL